MIKKDNLNDSYKNVCIADTAAGALFIFNLLMKEKIRKLDLIILDKSSISLISFNDFCDYCRKKRPEIKILFLELPSVLRNPLLLFKCIIQVKNARRKLYPVLKCAETLIFSSERWPSTSLILNLPDLKPKLISIRLFRVQPKFNFNNLSILNSINSFIVTYLFNSPIVLCYLTGIRVERFKRNKFYRYVKNPFDKRFIIHTDIKWKENFRFSNQESNSIHIPNPLTFSKTENQKRPSNQTLIIIGERNSYYYFHRENWLIVMELLKKKFKKVLVKPRNKFPLDESLAEFDKINNDNIEEYFHYSNSKEKYTVISFKSTCSLVASAFGHKSIFLYRMFFDEEKINVTKNLYFSELLKVPEDLEELNKILDSNL